MASKKNRRSLVLIFYGVLLVLILLAFSSTSKSGRFIFFTFTAYAGTLIPFVIFYKLAGDTVLPLQDDPRPISLGLLRNAFSDRTKPDERQVAVRNAAYYKAYRLIVYYLLLLPWIQAPMARDKVILVIYLMPLFLIVFSLPQAIILWTEPDLPEEA